MNEKRAREILAEYIQEDDSLISDSLRTDTKYINYYPSSKSVTLDDKFSAEELEAIVWWMKNKNK